MSKFNRLSGKSNMGHVGLENDLTPPEHLVAMAQLWHYGWEWKGPEPYEGALLAANGAFLCPTMCLCARADCGLVTVVEPECSVHRGCQAGTAKQLHKAVDCPGPLR